jgi:hypothetical protein
MSDHWLISWNAELRLSTYGVLLVYLHGLLLLLVLLLL